MTTVGGYRIFTWSTVGSGGYLLFT
jgi:hypothetical protein